jgi:polyisoprenoid-binding protein YceI
MMKPVHLAVLLLAGVPCLAAGRSYVIDPSQGEVAIHVGKSGLLSFTGHEHHVLAVAFSGRIVADSESVGSSSVQISFEAKSLKVQDKGEPAGDAAKVEAAMTGAGVLDVAHFPTITFVSKSVSGTALPKGAYDLTIAGDLSLHGVQKAFTLPVHVEVSTDALVASGHVGLRQTAFGMTPVSVAGVVKVRDEVGIDFKIVARPEP